LRLIFWQGFLSDVLNPKVALFYLALLPQFINAHDPNPLKHLIALGVIGNMVGIATSITYVFLAARMTSALRRNHAISYRLTKTMGALFVGLGLKLATEKI
jgi:threonine/homoserine/homoserine lactone efflux protein